MKLPKIIFSLILAAGIIGGLLAFRARESQRFLTYYFTTTSTAWTNPNNWTTTAFLFCPSPKEQLCGLILYTTSLLYPNGKPRVDQNPLYTNISHAIANKVEIYHADFVVLLEP